MAGAFYPDDPGELQAIVDGFLSRSHQLPHEPLLLIVPYAGYVYSGATAGTAFRQLQGREYDSIVVLGTSHHSAGLQEMAIWPSGAFSTPLGLMPIDSELAQRIIFARALDRSGIALSDPRSGRGAVCASPYRPAVMGKLRTAG